MAGTTGRQALKKAALLALDDSRSALSVEMVRLRPMLHPADLVRQSVAKHRVALMVGAAVAGLIAVRFLIPSASRRGSRTWRDAIMGTVTGAGWALLKGPLIDFAKSHFSSYLDQTYNSPTPVPNDPA